MCVKIHAVIVVITQYSEKTGLPPKDLDLLFSCDSLPRQKGSLWQHWLKLPGKADKRKFRLREKNIYQSNAKIPARGVLILKRTRPNSQNAKFSSIPVAHKFRLSGRSTGPKTNTERFSIKNGVRGNIIDKRNFVVWMEILISARAEFDFKILFTGTKLVYPETPTFSHTKELSDSVMTRGAEKRPEDIFQTIYIRWQG